MKQKHAQVAPFFVVNHQLNDIPYLRQFVRDCAAAGCDGFFMHPREGLLTPYLSEAWFDAIGACIDEAKKRGIQAWIYDEFPYPSGGDVRQEVGRPHRLEEVARHRLHQQPHRGTIRTAAAPVADDVKGEHSGKPYQPRGCIGVVCNHFGYIK